MYGTFCKSFLSNILPILIISVGAPIKVDKVKNPSPEEIEKFHVQYIKALEGLFEKHKKNYGISEDKHLEICWSKKIWPSSPVHYHDNALAPTKG